MPRVACERGNNEAEMWTLEIRWNRGVVGALGWHRGERVQVSALQLPVRDPVRIGSTGEKSR